jgi:hypothetical protein
MQRFWFTLDLDMVIETVRVSSFNQTADKPQNIKLINRFTILFIIPGLLFATWNLKNIGSVSSTVS